MKQPPAFQFYPADFLADENVMLMSNQELGCYMKLMCYAWREGSIPSDIGKIAKLCGEDSSAMAQLWLAVSSCFAQASDRDDRLVHPRLDHERIKQQEHRKERAESGKKGAESRWSKAHSSAIQQPMANDGSSSSSSSSSSSESKEQEQEHAQPSVAPPVVELEIVPDGIKRAKREPTAARFDEFWAIYPVRKGKDAALAKWKARGYDQIADQIITDVRKRMLHDRQWLAGFVPHGSTYVNGRGWQDDVEADQKPQATKHGAADDFRGKQYDGTDLSKLPPELRAAIEADLGA